jgi:hypothetical protein
MENFENNEDKKQLNKKIDNYFPNVDVNLTTKQALIRIADQLDEKIKQQVVADYNNTDFMEYCKTIRENNLQKSASKTSFRELYRFPSKETLLFLESIFKPFYGENWQKHPHVWNNEMVKVWRVSN